MLKQLFKTLLQTIYLNKTAPGRWNVFSCLSGIGLIGFCLFYTKQRMFGPPGWNLFLLFIPYFITQTVIRHPAWIEKNSRFAILCTVWLLFIPNLFYIATDFPHLQMQNNVPYWLDLALIFSFAWNGILRGIA